MKRHIKFIVVLACLILVVCTASAHLDSFLGDQVIYTDKLNDPVEKTAAGEVSWTSSAHSVTRGDWKFRIQYHSDSDDNYVVVYSSREMPENSEAGSKGKELARIPLPQGSERSETTVHFAEGMSEICVQVFHVDGDLSLSRVEILDATQYTDKYWAIGILTSVCILLYYLLCIRFCGDENRNQRLVIVSLLFTVIFTSLPLMNTFLANTHDLCFHISRIEGIVTAMENHEFPMWINMSGQYYLGYANPVLYPQLFLYIPAAFMLLGMSAMNAYKLFLVIINAVCAMISYSCFKRLFKSRPAGLITAIAYSLCLYRLMDIYTRGAMGEILSAVFLPLCFYGMYEICLGDEDKWGVLLLGVTGVFSSHILSAVFIAFFAGISFLVLIPIMLHRNLIRRVIALIKAGIFTFAVNLYFIVPFLHYYLHEPLRILTRNNGKAVAGNAAYISQLFLTCVEATSTRVNMEFGTTQGEMAITVGLVIPVCCLIFLYLTICEKRAICKPSMAGASEAGRLFKLGDFAVIWTIVSVYLTSDLCPWETIAEMPVLHVFGGIQFPWRLLMFTQLFGIIVLGCLVQIVIIRKPRWKKLLLAALTVLTIMSAVPYIDSTADQIVISDRALAGVAATDDLYRFTVKDEENMAAHYNYLGVSSSVKDTSITGFSRNGSTLRFHYQLPAGNEETVLSLPLYAYPGFELTVNGDKKDYSADEWGLMELRTNVPEGDVLIRSTGSPSWRMAYIISGAAIVLLLSGEILRHSRMLKSTK